jgi:hypothetical protein
MRPPRFQKQKKNSKAPEKSPNSLHHQREKLQTNQGVKTAPKSTIWKTQTTSNAKIPSTSLLFSRRKVYFLITSNRSGTIFYIYKSSRHYHCLSRSRDLRQARFVAYGTNSFLMHYRFDFYGGEHIFDANVAKFENYGLFKKDFHCTEHCWAYLLFKHLAFLKYIILRFILGGTLGNYPPNIVLVLILLNPSGHYRRNLF